MEAKFEKTILFSDNTHTNTINTNTQKNDKFEHLGWSRGMRCLMRQTQAGWEEVLENQESEIEVNKKNQ